MTPELSAATISINRIVRYVLSQMDAAAINRRRTDGGSIAERMNPANVAGKIGWPAGAQAHIGNPVAAGDVFPAMVAKVTGEDQRASCSMQVFLDGTDVLWAESRPNDGDKSPGTWHWPPRVG